MKCLADRFQLKFREGKTKRKKAMRNLFDLEEQEPDWKQEWKDMPEFLQANKEPCQKIVINFQTYDDVKKFAELLGFSVTNKTKSIWFPIKEKDKPREYAYVDTNK